MSAIADFAKNIGGLVEAINANMNRTQQFNADVYIQDQTTRSLDLHFTYPLNESAALDGAVSQGDYEFTLAAGHGAVVGNTAAIIGTENQFSAGIITAVSTNDITIDTPVCCDFADESPVLILDDNLGSTNGNGTQASPKIYKMFVPSSFTVELDVTRILFQMTCASAVSLGKFGDLTALTNGLVLRKVSSSGVINNLLNVKNNADISLHAYDVTFFEATNPALAVDGLSARMSWAGQDKRGVTIRLAPGDELQAVIQDDLSWLTSFYLLGEGHQVED